MLSFHSRQETFPLVYFQQNPLVSLFMIIVDHWREKSLIHQRENETNPPENDTVWPIMWLVTSTNCPCLKQPGVGKCGNCAIKVKYFLCSECYVPEISFDSRYLPMFLIAFIRFVLITVIVQINCH